MARFLAIWRVNPSAPWPTDPSKNLEMLEKMWASIDDLIRKGEIEEIGSFPEALVGYTISKGEAIDVYRRVSMFNPYFVFEIHEMLPWEKTKETLRAVSKAQIAAMKK
jgi:hypothetical protein